MGDPLSPITGALSLAKLAVKLVVGAVGLIDKTTASHRGAARELQDLLQDLERLETQMNQIHDKLQFMAADTKDRALKALLKNKYGKIAIENLRDALDDTFTVFKQLTDRAEAEESNLQALALPANKKSLAYMLAILKHNFSSSKVADVVNNLQSMRSDIRACFERLESSFGHVNYLYKIANNRLVRVSGSTSIVSTSSILTARIKLAGWLKQREGTWGLLRWNRPRGLKLARPDIFSPGSDARRQDFLASGPVLGVPYEIFRKILHHLCSDGPLQLRYVLFVSKRLYHAAISDASLWTTISFDHEFFAHFKRRPRYQADRFIEQCLFRSTSLPLSLTIQPPKCSDQDPLLRHLSSFKNPKYKGLERCFSLIWSCPREVNINNRSANLLPEEFPSLQFMSVSGWNEKLNGSRFPNCPMLVQVEMLDHIGRFTGTIFAHVTTLSFGNSYTHLWGQYDREIFSQFPVLYDLTLFTVVKKGKSVPPSAQPIQVQTLKILRAHGNIPSGVFTSIVAPALQELHIKGDAENFTSIGALSRASGLSFSHLYALLPEAVSMREPKWAIRLSQLVQGCTKLETLHISKWMEAKCKKSINIKDSRIIFNVH